MCNGNRSEFDPYRVSQNCRHIGKLSWTLRCGVMVIVEEFDPHRVGQNCRPMLKTKLGVSAFDYD